jgi:CubicO group peptidase (beta-lactamase class C family)
VESSRSSPRARRLRFAGGLRGCRDRDGRGWQGVRMRRILKGLMWLVLVLAALAAGLAVWKREEITRLMAVNTLFAEDRIVRNFSNMDALFLHRTLRAGSASPLPRGPEATMPDGFQSWLEARQVTGVVVLHRGAVVHESYHLGTGEGDLRISWSVAKSVLSLVLGTMVADGTIPDLDAPVTQYVPALRSSAYSGATIRQVAQMASGIAFNEDYLDFWSDINRMGRVLALGGSMDGFARGQTARRGAPGADWQYVSIDTHVLGMVMRAASGRTVSELVEERLFLPLGLERAPYYVTDGDGVEFVLGGLNMTTRDYARLGQLVAQGGLWEGRQIVPAGWIDASTAASAPGGVGYGLQWWLADDPRPGEVYGRGVYGQYLWIDRAAQVVIAVNAADRRFREPGVNAGTIALFRAIVDGLSQGNAP